MLLEVLYMLGKPLILMHLEYTGHCHHNMCRCFPVNNINDRVTIVYIILPHSTSQLGDTCSADRMILQFLTTKSVSNIILMNILRFLLMESSLIYKILFYILVVPGTHVVPDRQEQMSLKLASLHIAPGPEQV